MPRYALGQPIYLPITVKDRTGALVDASTLAVDVLKPDGITHQVYSSPTHDSTGTYHQDVPVTDLGQIGHYQFVVTSTGVGSGVSRGEFDVFDPFEPDILPLQDAKKATGTSNTTIYDDDLQAYVDTIVSNLELITGGPIYNRTVSERVLSTGNLRNICLRQRPLVSVTSITDTATGLVMPITDIDVDLNSGIIRRKLGFPFWSRGIYYQVVYVAGQGTVIPAAFNTAARIIIQHLWETQRGPGLSPMSGLETTVLPGMSFAIPNRALEVLRPFTQEAYV